MVQSVDAFCAFGDQVVVADLCVDGLIVCRSPGVGKEQTVPVSLSFNGNDYVNFTYLEFEYFPEPIVTKIYPVRGSIAGDTEVRVDGQHFNIGSTLGEESVNKVACRFGDQLVSTTLNSDRSISCVSPPVRRVYEIQQLTTALVPYQPQEVRLRAASDPVEGAKFDIIVQNDEIEGAIQSVTVSPPGGGVAEIQTVTISTDIKPAKVATLMVRDQGRLPEIQKIVSSSASNPDIQAVIFRAPYGSFQAENAEMQGVIMSNSSAIIRLSITIDEPSHVAHGNHSDFEFDGTKTVSEIQSLLNAEFGENSINCTSVDLIDSGVTIEFIFDEKLGNVETFSVDYVSIGTASSYVISDGGFAEIQTVILSEGATFSSCLYRCME